MLSPSQQLVLEALLERMSTHPSGVDSFRFEVDHEEHLTDIDNLVSERLIERKNDHYVLPLRTLMELAPKCLAAQDLLDQCSCVFSTIRTQAKKSPREKILMSDLARLAEMIDADVRRVVVLMLDAPVWGGYSTDLTGADAYVVPADRILRYKTFEDVLELLRSWARTSVVNREFLGPTAPGIEQGSTARSATIAHNVGQSLVSQPAYVHASRLQELRLIKSTAWDLTRLVRLCEELNTAHEHGCLMAAAMLLRSIIDHVPPIFDYESFKELGNNYGGAKSFRDSMRHLDTALRPVADGHLHLQVRRAESLPTPNQVDFRAALDVLLAEVARLLRQGSSS